MAVTVAGMLDNHFFKSDFQKKCKMNMYEIKISRIIVFIGEAGILTPDPLLSTSTIIPKIIIIDEIIIPLVYEFFT